MGAQMVPEPGVLFAGLLKGSIKKKKSNPKCSAEDKEKIPNLLETSELWKRRSRADSGSESSRKESVDLWPWQ